MLSFFPRGVLDEILNLIGSVSEEFPSYSYSESVTLVLNLTLYLNLCVISDSFNSEILYSVVLTVCWFLTLTGFGLQCINDLLESGHE